MLTPFWKARWPEAAFEPVDTIRPQVGVDGENELLAWPDSARLE